MPGKLWPTLFGEKKVIEYVWRSNWQEPKPAVTVGTILFVAVILAAVLISIISAVEEPSGLSVSAQAALEKAAMVEIQEPKETVPKKSTHNLKSAEELNPPTEVQNILPPEIKTPADKNEKIKKVFHSRPVTEFGWHYSEIYQDWRFCPGIDLSVSEKEIPAIWGGEVADVSRNNLGLTLVITHGQYNIHYSALDTSFLEKGTKIAAGDAVGFVRFDDGRTDKRIHLRVESLAAGKFMDPMEILF